MSLKNTFLIDMNAKAAAMGDLTATYTATSTAAVPGFAVGFAAATAFAQNVTPHTSAETAGLVSGGYITAAMRRSCRSIFPSVRRPCRSTSP